MDLVTAFEKTTPLSEQCKNALLAIIKVSYFDTETILQDPQNINDTI